MNQVQHRYESAERANTIEHELQCGPYRMILREGRKNATEGRLYQLFMLDSTGSMASCYEYVMSGSQGRFFAFEASDPIRREHGYALPSLTARDFLISALRWMLAKTEQSPLQVRAPEGLWQQPDSEEVFWSQSSGALEPLDNTLVHVDDAATDRWWGDWVVDPAAQPRILARRKYRDATAVLTAQQGVERQCAPTWLVARATRETGRHNLESAFPCAWRALQLDPTLREAHVIAWGCLPHVPSEGVAFLKAQHLEERVDGWGFGALGWALYEVGHTQPGFTAKARESYRASRDASAAGFPGFWIRFNELLADVRLLEEYWQHDGTGRDVRSATIPSSAKAEFEDTFKGITAKYLATIHELAEMKPSPGDVRTELFSSMNDLHVASKANMPSHLSQRITELLARCQESLSVFGSHKLKWVAGPTDTGIGGLREAAKRAADDAIEETVSPGPALCRTEFRNVRNGKVLTDAEREACQEAHMAFWNDLSRKEGTSSNTALSADGRVTFYVQAIRMAFFSPDGHGGWPFRSDLRYSVLSGLKQRIAATGHNFLVFCSIFPALVTEEFDYALESYRKLESEDRFLAATTRAWLIHGCEQHYHEEYKRLLDVIKTSLPDYENTTVRTNRGTYVGELSGGKPHGLGKYSYWDGTHYEGGYKHAVKHGHGSYVWPSGDRYVGQFEDGRETGGWYSFSDGSQDWSYRNENGEWVDSEPPAGSGSA